MMAASYKLIFSLNISHSYFENGQCSCVCFKPGPVTRILQRRFELRILNRPGGFDFYVSTLQSGEAFLAYLKKVSLNAYFDFELESLHPDFIYFTAFPINCVGKLNYDSATATNSLLAESYTDEALNGSVVGQLKIRFDDLLSQPFKSAVFNISLKAKATQWQYYVVNKSAIVLTSPLIADKNNVAFTGPENVLLETGQAALLFTSGNELIPLSEVPKYRFDLRHRPSSPYEIEASKPPNARFVLKGLPCPDPRRFGQVEIGGHPQFSSPMYIYV